jgi:hypothetical protein
VNKIIPQKGSKAPEYKGIHEDQAHQPKKKKKETCERQLKQSSKTTTTKLAQAEGKTSADQGTFWLGSP